MLKISDNLIKEMINIMKIHVDFNQNKKKFLLELLNKKLPVNDESKKYLDFLQKESLIYDLSYEIKSPLFDFVNLFHVNDNFSVNDYSFKFYTYQREQVLSTTEAPPLQDLRQGKNIIVLNKDIIVPCITYQEKPFCIFPIKEIIKKQTYGKIKGKVLLYGIGLGNHYYNLLKNDKITEIDIKEDNEDLKSFFINFIFPKFNSNTTCNFISSINENDYDFIIIADEYLDKKIVNDLYIKYCNNKKIIFTNQRTIENDLKIEIFRQLVIFIGDPQNINKDSKIGENLFYYLMDYNFELKTLQELFIFLDEHFKHIITYKKEILS